MNQDGCMLNQEGHTGYSECHEGYAMHQGGCSETKSGHAVAHYTGVNASPDGHIDDFVKKDDCIDN